MERLAIKWATLEPDAIGSYVTYADAVQAVEETHRSYGGLPSQLEEAKAKIKELECLAYVPGARPGLTEREYRHGIEVDFQSLSRDRAGLRERVAELEAHTKVAESDFVLTLLRIHGLLGMADADAREIDDVVQELVDERDEALKRIAELESTLFSARQALLSEGVRSGVIERQRERPRIVCLCGSTKFFDEYKQANLQETLKGRIVLSIGVNLRTDSLPDHLDENVVKEELDELHKRKIDMADEILVIDVGGYIGESSKSEIEYAQASGKCVRLWSEEQPK